MKKIFYFKLSTFLILLVFSLKANCQKDLTFKITDGAKYTTGRVSGFWGKANDEIQIGEASLMAYKYYGWCIVESKNIPFQGDIEIFNMALGFGISDFTGTDIEIEMGLFFKDEINPYTDSGSDIQSFIENESSGKTCSIVINSTQNTAIFELTSEMKKIVARALSSNDDWVGFYFRQKKRNSNDYASCEFYGYTSSIITSRIIYSYSFEDELEFNDTYASAFNLGNFNYSTNTALMTNVLCIENPEVRGYTDVDYFKFSFNNKYYLIIVKATDYGPYVLSFSISNGTLTVETKQADYQINTILELKDSQGNLYATDDNGGWADFSKIIYTFPPPTGSLKVNIYPSDAVDAYAKWNVDGGSWKDSGTTVSGLSTGNHTVSFRSISGWNTPSNKTVSIEDSQTTTVTGTYTQQTGSLSVTISPNDAVNAGAQWNVDGGAWKNNGATVSGLSVGNHTVSFKDISGWSTPSNKTVSISSNQTTSTTGTYTQQTGSLSVSLAPSDAINAGAQWNVDGGAWKNSGTTVSGLSVGNHTVSFKSISGWNAPSNKTVTINSNQTTSTTGTYTQQTQQTGSLKVTLSPSDAVNAGAQWNVDGGAWKNSGVTVSGLSIGNHTVSFKSISGWNTPSNKTVTINSNQTTSTTGTYTQQTQQTGSLKVTLSPSDAVNAGAQWNVDGGAWKSSGVTVSGLSIGNHTVSFKSISGWNAPSNKTVTINSNQTTSTTGTYTQQTQKPNLTRMEGMSSLTIDGEILNNSIRVINIGNENSNSCYVGYYLSSNTSITPEVDYFIGENYVQNLSPQDFSDESITVDLSTLNIPTGEYYFGYIIDYKESIDESDESDNGWYFNSPKITIESDIEYFLTEENFDGDIFPPLGWDTLQTQSDATWRKGNLQNFNFNSIDADSKYSAFCGWTTKEQEEVLISPKFYLNSENSKLEFYVYYNSEWINNANMTLYLVKGPDVTFIDIWQCEIDGQEKWRKVEIDLSDFEGNDPYVLAWWYSGNDGYYIGIDNVKLTKIVTSSEATIANHQNQIELLQNYPNPFSEKTTIKYFLPEYSNPTLQIFDFNGRLIETIINDNQIEGYHDLEYDGKNLSNGIYYYKLTTGKNSKTRKMIKIK